MEIKLPFGSVRASGRIVIMVILCLALVGVLLFHDWKSTNQNNAMIEALQAVSYVLTLSERERKDLHLDMPDSIRDKFSRPRDNHQ